MSTDDQTISPSHLFSLKKKLFRCMPSFFSFFFLIFVGTRAKSYSTQTIVDMPNTKKSDLRRARSGMVNLCPTSTGSATAIIEIYPELKGKLNGLAVRVPLLNASLTDCVFEVKRTVTKEEVNAALEKASLEGPLKGILGYEIKPLVSTDYTNDTRSSIVDALSTQVIDGTMVKIYAWYDNEAGYSKRMAELCNIVAAMNITNTEPAFQYK